MLEKKVERYLVEQVRKVLKGIAYKFTSPSRRSVPDRICVIPHYIFFVECKATGGVLTPAQVRERTRLVKLGHNTFMVDSKEAVDSVIKFYSER